MRRLRHATNQTELLIVYDTILSTAALKSNTQYLIGYRFFNGYFVYLLVLFGGYLYFVNDQKSGYESCQIKRQTKVTKRLDMLSIFLELKIQF